MPGTERQIHMKRHSSRILPAAFAASLVLAACGGGTDDTATPGTDGPVTSVAAAGLLPPRPIEIASGGVGGAAGVGNLAAASGEEASDQRMSDMAMPYFIADYVVGEGMPALPTNDIGYVFQTGSAVTSEQVAALATTFGAAGEPVRVDDGYSVYWRVGPEDGTAPTLWVYEDAQLSWNFNSAWADQRGSVGCAVAEPAMVDPDEGTDVVADTIVEGDDAETSDVVVTDSVVVDPDAVGCDEPAPPEGVPTAAEAEQRARDLVAATGADPAAYQFETYADEWYASVSAVRRLDGLFDAGRFDFGFGAEGVMQYAGGQLAEPQRVGPYPLVGLDEAVARLSDQNSMWFGGGYARGGVAVMDDMAVGVAESAVDASGAGEATELLPPETMPVEDLPVDSVPPEDFPEPEAVTVTLVDVEADVWWAWDAEGSVWLLPAYRFIDTDGGWHVVPAVTDEFMIQVDPPVVIDEPLPAPEPLPATSEPVVGAPTPAPDAPPTTTADFVTTDFDDLVGLPLDEFTKLAEARGAETRVVVRDGEGLDTTDDFNPARVNVDVDTVDGVETVGSISSIG